MPVPVLTVSWPRRRWAGGPGDWCGHDPRDVDGGAGRTRGSPVFRMWTSAWARSSICQSATTRPTWLSPTASSISPDKAQVYREAFRVLKPGGRLAVSDVVATTELPQEWRDDMRLLSACISRASSAAEARKCSRPLGLSRSSSNLETKPGVHPGVGGGQEVGRLRSLRGHDREQAQLARVVTLHWRQRLRPVSRTEAPQNPPGG